MSEEILFHQAIAKPADERSAFLDAACGGDTALRQRVEVLLGAHENADESFLKPPSLVPTIEHSRITEQLGTVIGPYKLLQQIGEGGMGTVYMAEQTQPVHRKVALKVIKPGMDSRQIIARFEAERQALAMMDHVNIARVLDAGQTPPSPPSEGGAWGGGRPYFVMELVHGVPITKYCDDNHLSPRERLELFLPVCQAIQHAHQKGIIHRDIKPSNVMITLYDGKPVPKVIDFGVAKATEQKLTERTLFTQYGTIVGTLEYMSPEQAEMSALGVDTRSDIYSLGVLLYELLTGSTPLSHKRLKEAAFAEILRMIKEEEPPKPSTRLSDSGEALASISAQRQTEPAKLTKLVRGDLDWITMKALEKDRARRYETANGLARDVQRYLADEPVEATPPSAAYKLRKFLRRNRGPVLAAALLFLALVGGIVGTSLGLLEARRQSFAAEQAAQRERHANNVAQANARQAQENATKADKSAGDAIAAQQKAEQNADVARRHGRLALDTLRGVIFNVQRGLENVPGAADVRRKLLRDALNDLAQISGEHVDPSDIDRNKMVVLCELGDLSLRIGSDEGSAAETARTLYDRAYEIAQALAAVDPTDTEALRDLSTVIERLAIASQQMGELARARDHFAQMLKIKKRLADQDPADREATRELSVTYEHLGDLSSLEGDLNAARNYHENALEIRRKLAAAHRSSARAQRDLSVSLGKVGQISAEAGNLDKARKYHQEALEIDRKRVEAAPNDGQARRDLASSLEDLGEVCTNAVDLEEALRYHEEALTIRSELASVAPMNAQAQRDVSASYQRLGKLSEKADKLDPALEYYRKFYDITTKLASADPSNAEAQRDLFAAITALGTISGRLGRRDQALKYYEQAVDIGRKLAKTDPNNAQAQHDLSTALNNLCNESVQAADLDAALKYCQEALEISSRLAKGDLSNAQTQIILNVRYYNLGQIEQAKKQYAKAIEWYEKALAVLREFDNAGKLAPADRHGIAVMEQAIAACKEAQTREADQ